MCIVVQLRPVRAYINRPYSKRDRAKARGYKTFFMLNSAEHENYPAHKC